MDNLNTGMQRAVDLLVGKKANGDMVEGYPRVYSLLNGFLSFNETSEKELSIMPIGQYKERLKAFKQYVESVEMGVSVDANLAWVKNTGACPLPDVSHINYLVVTYHRSVSDYLIHKISVQADTPVASDISVIVTVRIVTQESFTKAALHLKAGESYSELDTWLIEEHVAEIADPVYDDTYEYITIGREIKE